jgi:VanZ family protein
MSFTRNHLWPFLLMGLVFFASGRTRLATPDVAFSIDKVGHFVVFGMIAVCWLRHPLCAGKGWMGGVIAIVLTSGYGALDEWRQSFTPGREVELWDWVADTVGAVTAVVMLLAVPGLRHFLERAPADIRLQYPRPSDSSE